MPLSESLYAVGQLEEADKVLLDIGTGFYVQKSIPDAQAYISRKMVCVCVCVFQIIFFFSDEKRNKRTHTQKGILEEADYAN